MKSEKTLIKKCNELEIEKKEVIKKYNTLNMKSFKELEEGLILLRRISSLDGQIAILKWILK